jgi:hypothetical protein
VQIISVPSFPGGVFLDNAEFDVAGLLETPVVEADFVDEGFVNVIGRLKVAGVAVAHIVVLDPFLRQEAESARAEAVLSGVLARNALRKVARRQRDGRARGWHAEVRMSVFSAT